MDPVQEIKARLPIDQLVSQYCQIKKKGRDYVALCPFHNDTHPSMQVSPDKGIAYCFACQSGGDIFSFYQKIEGVDFRQALKDLAEKTGITLQDFPKQSLQTKDEKERLRSCLETAALYFQKSLLSHAPALQYLEKRGVSADARDTFALGYAPDSFNATYDHLLKQDFSRSELLTAGLVIQRELQDGRVYDRFRNRLMFPIHDTQGNIVGFGGRTLGDDDAKYINSSESPLYHKSGILFNAHRARDAMRKEGTAILVEGYFDVLACHRLGVENVVAASGTALTEQHAKLLKRQVGTVILSLDQDRAGKEAAKRAFLVLSGEGLQVHAVTFEEKDPDEAAAAHPDLLRQLLRDKGVPYIDTVLQELSLADLQTASGKRAALEQLLPLVHALSTSIEKDHYIGRIASALQTTSTTIEEDLSRMGRQERRTENERALLPTGTKEQLFSPEELTLGLFLLYPRHLGLLDQLIEPPEGFASALFTALKQTAPVQSSLAVDRLPLSVEDRSRAAILQLYCEQLGFLEWNDAVAVREIRMNCKMTNRFLLKKKQLDIARQMRDAQRSGRGAEEAQLQTQYQQVLKLAKMAG